MGGCEHGGDKVTLGSDRVKPGHRIYKIQVSSKERRPGRLDARIGTPGRHWVPNTVSDNKHLYKETSHFTP